jgi:hypothetical protein
MAVLVTTAYIIVFLGTPMQTMLELSTSFTLALLPGG